MIVAVVPVKSLAKAKSRLAVHLSDSERIDLVFALLNGMVSALRDSGVVDIVLIGTDDHTTAHNVGAVWVPDGGSLNNTLEQAAWWAIEQDAETLLVVPADLPYVTAGDVRALVAEQVPSGGVIVAPSYDGGTGALLLSPPGAIRFAFGSDSARRHVQLAHRAKLPVKVMNLTAFRQDIDTYEDLLNLRSDVNKRRTGNMAFTGASLEADL